MNLVQLLHSDYKKYQKYGGHFFVIVFFTQGFWAVFQYRIAHFIYTKVKWQPFRFLGLLLMLFWQKVIEITTGIAIPASTQIGHSFYIGHFGGIIINANTNNLNYVNKHFKNAPPLKKISNMIKSALKIRPSYNAAQSKAANIAGPATRIAAVNNVNGSSSSFVLIGSFLSSS